MNETQLILGETTDRLFGELTQSRPVAHEMDGRFRDRWRLFEEMGLQALLVPEERGGFGGGAVEAWLVFHKVGLYALDLPVVEAILASSILSGAGLELPSGIVTLAARPVGALAQRGGGWTFTGSLQGVPWGRQADHVAAVIDHEGTRIAFTVPVAEAERTVPGANAADEPRDSLFFAGCAVDAAPACAGLPALFDLGALVRSAQIAGACRGALDLTKTHVNDRSQFGRPLAKFQAIQHKLATLAEHAGLCEMASRTAFEAVWRGAGLLEIASSKTVANNAAEQAVAISHQAHGAIGFTWEYDLHHFTRRLIGWGSEFGNSRYWTAKLGTLAAEAGPDGFWPLIVDGTTR
jgi:acyl-CoA dehydrogenase